MTFEDGVAKLLTAEPPPKPDRVPVTEAHRIGVTDPLSAMLIPVVVDGFSGPLPSEKSGA